MAWLGLAVALAILSMWLWMWARKKRESLSLPAGEVIYSDHGTWLKQHKPLFADDLNLVGQPDYLVQGADGVIIPVELKSSKAPARPHKGHIMQLAAYCLLVEEAFGSRPNFGILQYRDKAFAIDYTMVLEDELLDLLAAMREDMFEGELNRSHHNPTKCLSCGMRDNCDQRLA